MAHASLPLRPRSVTFTAWGVFLLAMLNVWRAIGLYRQMDVLLVLGVVFDPYWRLAAALAWAIAFTAIAVALWRRLAWAVIAAPMALALYGLYHLGLLAFFVQSPVARQGWPAVALRYLLATLFAIWALNRPGAQIYFHNDSGKGINGE